MFEKARKEQNKLRLAFMGPSGSGKTYSALSVASGLGGKTAVIDTERGSASLYADKFEFDMTRLTSFAPQNFILAIQEAEKAGYDNLIIDSLSHAWVGKDGALELVDKVTKRSQSGNTFSAWREVTPLHNKMVDAIVGANMHVIVTMRTKTDYVMEKDEKTQKNVIRKVGLAPIQRDGLEFEFDLVGDLTFDNRLIITKTRCSIFANEVIDKPGKEFAQTLTHWLNSGVKAEHKPIEPALPAELNDEPKTAEQQMITGILEKIMEPKKPGQRIGFVINGIIYGTQSIPVLERGKLAVGKEITITYQTRTTESGKEVYDLLSLKTPKEVAPGKEENRAAAKVNAMF